MNGCDRCTGAGLKSSVVDPVWSSPNTRGESEEDHWKRCGNANQHGSMCSGG
nr:MAG TPA: hypothetical protein [Caudoviricetes sp.]